VPKNALLGRSVAALPGAGACPPEADAVFS
jgi:hypothetical protein